MNDAHDKVFAGSQESKTYDGKANTCVKSLRKNPSSKEIHTQMSQLFRRIRGSQPHTQLYAGAELRPPGQTKELGSARGQTAIGGNFRSRNRIHANTTKNSTQLVHPSDIARTARAKYGNIDKNLLRALTQSKLWQEKHLLAQLTGNVNQDLTASMNSVNKSGLKTDCKVILQIPGASPESPNVSPIQENSKYKRNYEPMRVSTGFISNRKEVVALAEWVVESIRTVKSGGEENIEQELNVYGKAMDKLVGIVGGGCKEQGIVFSGIWTQYQKLVKDMVGTLSHKTMEKEKDLKQLSCSLVFKFENKFKEYETQINTLKQETEKYRDENFILREMLRDYEHDQDTLLEKYNHLKEESQNLTQKYNEAMRLNKSLKLILLQSNDVENEELSPKQVREELLKLKLQKNPSPNREDNNLSDDFQLRTAKYRTKGTLVGSVDKAVARISQLTLGGARHSLPLRPLLTKLAPDGAKLQ